MARALELAREARNMGEVPVGAVVVRAGRILAQSFNLRETLHDPTAHAERLALTWAGRAIGSWRLDGCVLYVTLEPCAMCAARSSTAGSRGSSTARPIPRRVPARVFIAWFPTRGSITECRSRPVCWPRTAANSSKNSSRNAGLFVNWTRAKGSDGGVPEWLKGPVSKTGVPLRGTVGSNPTSSACKAYQRQPAAAAIELAILKLGRPLFEVRAPGWRQQQML